MCADAAYATALRGLLPFQSVNRLCFDAGARPYDEPVEGFISFDAHGNTPSIADRHHPKLGPMSHSSPTMLQPRWWSCSVNFKLIFGDRGRGD